MTTEAIFEIAGAIILSLGGGAAIVGVFTFWLGKVWAARILEGDRTKHQATIEGMKSDLNKKIHEHNVAVSRIDAHRADAIQQLYVSLVKCNEAAVHIMAPNNLHDDFAAVMSGI